MTDVRPFAGMAQETSLAEALNRLSELLVQMMQLADNLGFLSPDTAGRLRVVTETAVTVTGTIIASSLTNQAQMGGYAANQQIIALTLGNEADLRRNIIIS
jgi:hypothetical protein